MDIPRAQSLPTTVTDASLGRGLSEGVTAGANMSYLAAQSAKLRSDAQIAAQKQALEEHQAKIKAAIDLNTTIGERLKYLAPEDQPDAVRMGLKAIANVAPELGIDPEVIPDNYQELYDQMIQAKRGHDETDPAKRLSDADYNEQLLRIGKRMSIAQKEHMKASMDLLPKTDLTPLGTTPGGIIQANAGTGEVRKTPIPGGGPISPVTTGVSPTEIDLALQRQFETKTQPLTNALNAAYAVHQLSKAAENDSTGANDYTLLQNAIVALNPNSILSREDAILDSSTAAQLMKTGGIPEQVTAYLQQKADGKILTRAQINDITKVVAASAKIKRTQLMSAMHGFSDISKRHGGDPARVTVPIAQITPPETGVDEGQDKNKGVSLWNKHRQTYGGVNP